MLLSVMYVLMLLTGFSTHAFMQDIYAETPPPPYQSAVTTYISADNKQEALSPTAPLFTLTYEQQNAAYARSVDVTPQLGQYFYTNSGIFYCPHTVVSTVNPPVNSNIQYYMAQVAPHEPTPVLGDDKEEAELPHCFCFPW